MKKNRWLALAVGVFLLAAAVGGGTFLYLHSPNRASQKPSEPPSYRVAFEQDLSPPDGQLKVHRVVLHLGSEVTGRQAVAHYLNTTAEMDILQVITPDGHFVALRTSAIKDPDQIPQALHQRILLGKRAVLAWRQGPYAVYRLE